MHLITSKNLSIEEIYRIFNSGEKIQLSEEIITKVQNCRAYLDEKIKNDSNPIYGINTGFGALHNVVIDSENLNELQNNLVRSHACGLGEEVPDEVVRMMLLLKIRSLSFGHSGVQVATIQRLVDFYNNDVIPIIYTKGSLGASGDLAPLAHLALPLLGEGEVRFKGDKINSDQVLKQFEWDKISLKSKEGLALLNGTQFMTAYGLISLFTASKISYFADVIGAVSLDAYNCKLDPFDPLIHMVRPHNGQISTAERIREYLEDSELQNQPKIHVQDPYSFRCIPQVHGATKDALKYIQATLVTELNAVTDNPNIFIDSNKILSGGNFHGQPLALVLDHLKIAVAELGNISERRIYKLLSGTRGLPDFLSSNAGLNSGLMIAQYTAASIVSYNKQLASPASVDSIVSSNGQEDHVSMGANGAVQVYELVNNVLDIIAIELLTALQALEFRKPTKSSVFIESLVGSFRNVVHPLQKDRILHDDLINASDFLKSFSIDETLLFRY
ncbi:MAG: histidine ammonia-lyase [bacterium]